MELDDLSKLSDKELDELATKMHFEMNKRGYAVIIWNPRELGGADPSHVEERSIELGWEHLVEGISPDEIDTLREFCDDWGFGDKTKITDANAIELVQSLRHKGENALAEKVAALDANELEDLIVNEIYDGTEDANDSQVPS